MYDPLYDEIVTNTSDLMVYITFHVFMELFLPLSIFFAVMITLFVDWKWIPLSRIEKEKGYSIELLKKHLFE